MKGQILDRTAEEKSALEVAVDSYNSLDHNSLTTEAFIEIENNLTNPFHMIKFYDAVLFDILNNPKKMKKAKNEGLVGYIKGEKIKANNQATELADRDQLSGALNKRKFGERCLEEISRADRNIEKKKLGGDRTYARKIDGKKIRYKDEPYLTVGVIDLNNFKKGINDKYGHDFGDKVLAVVGKAIRKYTRNSDIVGRLGEGDEFGIIVPETSEKSAYRIGKRLVRNVNKYATEAIFPKSEDTKHRDKISISLGLAVYDTHSRDYKQLLKFADNAMYLSKVISYYNSKMISISDARKISPQLAEFLKSEKTAVQLYDKGKEDLYASAKEALSKLR